MNVQPEPDGQIPVDPNAGSLQTSTPDPLTETQDGLGPVADGEHTQQVDGNPSAIGAQNEAKVTSSSKVTKGRHVKHTQGADEAKARHKHVADKRKESAKAFERGKRGAK